MFFRSFLAPTVALLAAAAQVQAHTIFTPALGVTGTAVRNDVQRPSTAKPCGTASLADIDTSTPAVATNGVFSLVAQNFNAGEDGSTFVKTATLDTTGTGASFPGTVTVTTNGVVSPPAVQPANLKLELPAGTQCTGGKTKNLCLVALVSDGGFGNCVVVQTAAGTGTATTTTTTTGTNTTSTTTGTGTGAGDVAAGTTTGNTTTTAKHHHHHANATVAAVDAAGVKTSLKDVKTTDEKCKDGERRSVSRDERRNARTLVDSMQRKAIAVRAWTPFF